MNQQTLIRLRPTDTEFLSTQAFDDGAIFYDDQKKTLKLMDGKEKGGYELLRADLSNLTGGSGGSSTINFGSRTIIAQAFVGDGSGLTNLPIPANIATQGYVNSKFETPATTSTFGTVKVDGVTITIDANGVISSTGGGGGGVDLTAFSVFTNSPGSASLLYNSTNGVFTFTPPDLSGYLTQESDTLDSVTSRGATTSNQITVNNKIIANEVDSGILKATSSLQSTGTLSVTGSSSLHDTTVNGTLYLQNMVNTGTGVPRWISGSDFVIQAAGEVNVSGSKIKNLGTPTDSTDAATKAYVDGAASAFNGGTVSGYINITDATASTSSTTGALRVVGGIGAGGDIYSHGLIYVWDTATSSYTPVLTSASGGYNGGIISGTVYINNTTVSTSTTSGALRVVGGVGIQGNLYTGPDANFNGIKFGRGAASGLGSNTNIAAGGGTGNDAPLAINVTGVNNVAIGFKSLSAITNASDNTSIGFNAQANRTSGNNNTSIGSQALSTGSTSNNTAVGSGAMQLAAGDTSTAVGVNALKNSGGSTCLGIGYNAGSSISTGDFNVVIGSNDGSTIDGSSNNIIIADGAGNIRLQINASGTTTITSTAGTSSVATGALVVNGGVGIAGGITTGGAVKINDSTASSSTTTGALTVAGGAGFAGNVYGAFFYGDGSGLTNVQSAGFAGGTVAGATYFSNTTASTSTSTGAVRIAGGLGVAGRVSAANFNGVTIPAAGSVPGANGLVRTDGSGYAYTNYINSNTANNENPAISQFIVTNGTDNYYRKSSLASVKSYLGITPVIGTPASNYGALAIQGEKNGWGGISFRNTAGTLCGTLMMTTTAQGIYAASDAAWLLQWDQSGNFTATANVTAYSDARLKKNVQKIENALDKVMQIDGVTFDRVDNGQRGTGVIAQQLQKVLPEAVLADKDGMLSVAYGNTVGMLIEAMKEQQRQIEALRAEIVTLKGN